MWKQEAVPMATQDAPSLYERLGGCYSIATVVDDLIDRLMADPRLNANPLVDEAHHKVPPAGFKYLVTDAVLGRRRSAEIHRQGHGELAPAPTHHAGRVGRVHGRPGADARQVRGPGGRAGGGRGHRREHPALDRRRLTRDGSPGLMGGSAWNGSAPSR